MSPLPLPERLETDRLILRKPVPADAEGIFTAYATDPEVTRYLTWRPHTAIDATEALVEQYLERWRTGEGEQAFVIAEKVRPEMPIGCIGITFDGHAAEAGFVLARRAWNRGLMTEALTRILDTALSRPAIRRVSAFCDTENTASACVLEKAGMVQEGCLGRYAVFPNLSDMPRDCLVFAVERQGA